MYRRAKLSDTPMPTNVGTGPGALCRIDKRGKETLCSLHIDFPLVLWYNIYKEREVNQYVTCNYVEQYQRHFQADTL